MNGMHKSFTQIRRLVILAVLAAGTVSARTEDSRWRAGLRHHLNWGGPNTRAGDIQGYGASLSYSYNARWVQSLMIDHLEYDLETPVHAVGLQPRVQDKPADSFTTVMRFQSELEFHARTNRRWDPYAAVGLGLYSINAADVSGNLAAGGTYKLAVDTPQTFGMSLKVGSNWLFKERFTLGVGFSYARTFKNYTVKDAVSGRSGNIKPLAPLGLTTELSYRF